jgi:hypothetical protein
MHEGQRLTKERARAVLEEARADIAMLLTRQFEQQAELYRVLAITGELYEGILHEDAPEYRVEAHAS